MQEGVVTGPWEGELLTLEVPLQMLLKSNESHFKPCAWTIEAAVARDDNGAIEKMCTQPVSKLSIARVAGTNKALGVVQRPLEELPGGLRPCCQERGVIGQLGMAAPPVAAAGAHRAGLGLETCLSGTGTAGTLYLGKIGRQCFPTEPDSPKLPRFHKLSSPPLGKQHNNSSRFSG